MLEGHRADPLATGALSDHVAHQPDETGDAADAMIAARQRGELGADVEILALDLDHGLDSTGRDSTGQPPVTGGNRATSSLGSTA